VPDLAGSETTTRLQQRLVDLFVQLCGDPDNAAVATEVDQTLHDLDDVLTSAAR
jgi:hypothetical protein